MRVQRPRQNAEWGTILFGDYANPSNLNRPGKCIQRFIGYRRIRWCGREPSWEVGAVWGWIIKPIEKATEAHSQRHLLD